MIRGIFILAAFSIAAAAQPDVFTQWLKPSDETVVTGNGSLSVTLNAFGQVTACRWPSPVGANHVTYDKHDDPAALTGLAWGLRFGESTKWLTGPPLQSVQRYAYPDAPIIETLCDFPDVNTIAIQTTVVHPTLDVLLRHLVLLEAEAVLELQWYADFSPSTQMLPKLPLGPALQAHADFATFYDEREQTLYQFRPLDPGSVEWREVKRWRETEGELPEFGPGVWIAYCADQAFTQIGCGDPGAGLMSNASHRSVGDSASFARMLVDRQSFNPEATVYIAFGEDRAGVDAQLKSAQKSGYDTLLAETRAHWQRWLSRANIPERMPPDLRALVARSLFTIATSTDRRTGAIARETGARALLARDYSRVGIWSGFALDMAGYHEEAERHLQFYLNTVRSVRKAGTPAGSLPVALYGNGADAFPHIALDMDAVAWLLWSAWQHDATLSNAEHSAFLERNWEQIDHAAALLLSWVPPGVPPLPSFDLRAMKDVRNDRFEYTAYIGLRSAAAIAQRLQQDRPDWNAARDTLQESLLRKTFNDAGNWQVEDAPALWPAELVDAGDRRWTPVTAQALKNLASMEPGDALETIFHLGMLWRDQADNLKSLETQAMPVLTRALADAPIDTYHRALAIATALTIYQ